MPPFEQRSIDRADLVNAYTATGLPREHLDRILDAYDAGAPTRQLGETFFINVLAPAIHDAYEARNEPQRAALYRLYHALRRCDGLADIPAREPQRLANAPAPERTAW